MKSKNKFPTKKELQIKQIAKRRIITKSDIKSNKLK
jgi:hypothetical protein